MTVIPVSPTDKPGSACPCFSCAVLGQLPSFRGQEADLEAESRDPEPPKAAAALPGECAVFPCWDGLGPPDWAAVGGLCGGVSALTVLFLWWNLSTLNYFCPSCSWQRVEMSRARLWLCPSSGWDSSGLNRLQCFPWEQLKRKLDDQSLNLENICETRKQRGELLWQSLTLVQQWWMRSIAAAACRRVSLALLTATVCIMTVVWTLFIKLSARLWQSSLLTSLSTFLKGSFAISEGRRCIFQSSRM